MTETDAIRWLAFEASRCKDRDAGLTLCLCLPPILAQLNQKPMDEAEAAAFRERLKNALRDDLRRAA